MKPDLKNLTGYCKWITKIRYINYGFITVSSQCEEEGKDIFFTASDIVTVNSKSVKSLESDEYVNFDITYSDRGARAINITAIVGETLQCEKVA